jgi:hypothetical protein
MSLSGEYRQRADQEDGRFEEGNLVNGFIDRLSLIAGGTPVAPPISDHRWLRRRLRRAAITLEPSPGRNVSKAADEFIQVAKVMGERCG